MDTSLLSGKKTGITPRSYGLGPFRLRARTINAEEAKIFQGSHRVVTKVKIHFTGRHRGYRWHRYFGTRFEPDVLDMPDNTVLEGNFQSERYFNDVAGQIRAELSLSQALPKDDAEAQALIEGQACPVSIHIRRGDYAAAAAQIHGLLPLSYYESAANFVAERCKDPYFLIFSDDPVWAQENLKIDFPHRHVVDPAGARPAHRDLDLMVKCRHHITANSSFSWWGAWLSRGEQKIVVAPRRWFMDPLMDEGDIIPAGWVRL